MKSGVLVAVMAAVTILLRFLPFWVFKGKTPAYITYLGKALPPAIIGMLVIYCLRNTSIQAAPHGLPELIAATVVIGLQAWKRNALASILTGTAAYMLMVQLVF
jgi:branched-subunit amino acid transport protein AzlD